MPGRPERQGGLGGPRLGPPCDRSVDVETMGALRRAGESLRRGRRLSARGRARAGGPRARRRRAARDPPACRARHRQGPGRRPPVGARSEILRRPRRGVSGAGASALARGPPPRSRCRARGHLPAAARRRAAARGGDSRRPRRAAAPTGRVHRRDTETHRRRLARPRAADRGLRGQRLRARGHGGRDRPVERAGRDRRRLLADQRSTGAARVLRRRHRVDPPVRSHHPTFSAGDRRAARATAGDGIRRAALAARLPARRGGRDPGRPRSPGRGHRGVAGPAPAARAAGRSPAR